MEGENIVPEGEKQPETKSNFDTKIKALFADVDPRVDEWNVSNGRPTVLQDVNDFTTAEDKFTDNWWQKLYKWMDERDFHQEKNVVAKLTIESLETLPQDASLPKDLKWNWINFVNGWPEKEPERQQILDTLRNPDVPKPLRFQLGRYLAESDVTPYSVDSIMEDYRIFGEDVGRKVRNQIFPLMLMGGADNKFEEYREDFIKLYENESSPSVNRPDKKQSLLKRINSRWKRSPSSSQEQASENRNLAERRVETIRNLVLELFPPPSEDPDGYGQWRRLHIYTGTYTRGGNAAKHLSGDLSTLPVEVLEKYLFDLRQLKSLPEFEKLSMNIASRNPDVGVVSPYVALGRATKQFGDGFIPVDSVIHDLDVLSKAGTLDERIVDEVLSGMEAFTNNDDIDTILRKNFRALIGETQLPYGWMIAYNNYSLLKIGEEDEFNNRLETANSMTLAYQDFGNCLVPAYRLLTDGIINDERAIELPNKADDILSDKDVFDLAYKYPNLFLATDRDTEFFRNILEAYRTGIDDIAEHAGTNMTREMALAFPKQANALMDDKMRETRLFIFNNGNIMLKDASDLRFFNSVVGEFGQKSDSLIRGYQESLTAGVISTSEKNLVLEFARQFRVISPTTLEGYKEAKEAGREKGYIAQLTALAEKMTGSTAITEEERSKPFYKDLLRHVYPNNSGNWTTYENNESCSDRSSDLAGFKIEPRYDIDLLSQSEIRVKSGEKLDPKTQEEVQAPIFAVSEKMSHSGYDYDKIKSDLKEEIDRRLNQVVENGGLAGLDMESVTTTEERLFLVLTDSIYGTQAIDSQTIKNLLITYEFANFEDISDYIAGTRDRVGRASNQDYALLCEVGTFYSDRLKEVNRGLVGAAWNNPAIADLMPEYFKKLSQETMVSERQDRINRLQVGRLGLSDSFVSQIGRVLEKRGGRKYEPDEVRDIIRRYEGITGGLSEKASISKSPQTRAFYGQLRSQREKTLEAMKLVTGEETDPAKVQLGEVNLQQVLETEANVREGKYDEEQFASYTTQRFIDLFEEEQGKIQGELDKFESISGKQREVLHGYITKSKESANARMVGGVCVAGDNPVKNPDQNMWDMPNYFQLVFQEPDTLQSQGLVLLHSFAQGDKKILSASINPSSTYLYSVDEEALFNGVMGTLEEFASNNGFDSIVLSKNKTVRTNRTGGQFEKAIDGRVTKVNKSLSFDDPQRFSYSPNYQLQDMDVVWENK